MKNYTQILLLLIILMWGPASSFGETVHSYINENGVQVYTNIPPSEQSSDSLDPEATANVDRSSTQTKTLSYDEIIEKYASDYQVDPLLIRSIIATESGFNPKAVSPKGARGLMQLMPATAQRLGVRNSFDPEENIRGGIKHFRSLLDNFKNDLELSLAAYNAGENLVRRLGRIPDFKETREYVASVKKKYIRNEPASLPEEEQRPVLYRYIDDAGVLHLTNIPPPQ